MKLTRISVCPGSLDAIQGALGTVFEAVDTVFEHSESASETVSELKSCSRAFVAIRPPGHHCGEVSKSGDIAYESENEQATRIRRQGSVS